MAKKDYKTLIIDYLKKYPNIELTRNEIIKNTGVSKSRLSEIVNSIKSDGYNISSPPRSGIIKLISSESDDVLPPIKDTDLRKWLIIFLLSKFDHLSFRELLLKMMSLKDYGLEHSHPYKSNVLQFDSYYNQVYTCDEFAVDLLFYSVETSAFYALGMNYSKKLIESRRLDWISNYEDTIRGLSDFSRYLRSFGYSVLALEPQELKDKMLFTYNRILERYEAINE